MVWLSYKMTPKNVISAGKIYYLKKSDPVAWPEILRTQAVLYCNTKAEAVGNML